MDSEAKMEKFRKEDPVFNEMVGVIEAKIEAQIEAYNNAKSKNPGWANNAKIKVFVPAFPMTPVQNSYLHSYLCNRFLFRIYGNGLKIRKCIFSNRYEIKSYYRDW